MKTINIFGRKMPIVAILMALLVVGTASAAVYFTFSGTVDVASPFSDDTNIDGISMIGGESYTFDISDISNEANTPILVELQTEVYDDQTPITADMFQVTYADGDGIYLSDLDGDEMQELVLPPGGADVTVTITTDEELVPAVYSITVSAISPEAVDFVELTYKDEAYEGGSWTPTEDMDAYVIYTTSSDDFEFCVKATGLSDAEDYYLVYYADDADRFDNPNSIETTILATIGLGDYYPHNSEDLFLIDSVNLGHNLPHPDDANADSINHDYRGAPDFYEDSTGAKLWLVPTDEYVSGVFTWANSEYLFDNGLVNYEDTSASA